MRSNCYGRRIKMDDWGELHWYLGMRILRSEDKIIVDQEKYVENLLDQFNMINCKPKATPGEVN